MPQDVPADAAEAELKAAAARTRAELAKSVAQTALEIADRVASTQRSKWALMGFALAAGIFVGMGSAMNRQGVNSGNSAGQLDGYTKARDEKAAVPVAPVPAVPAAPVPAAPVDDPDAPAMGMVRGVPPPQA